VGFPNPLIEERSISLLLLIGGPLTCMLSASIGVASLYASQLISAAQAPDSWLTWWAGDSIGVLIATPLMYGSNAADLPAYARPMIWQESWPVGGRRLQLSIAPSQELLQHNQNRQSWAQLVGSLRLCSLLGGFLLSITGRAEQVRRLVKQRTLELSAILENAVEAILIFDQQGHLDRANPAASKLFGYQTTTLLHQSLELLLPTLQGEI
jgi:PAS domain-containing protein